MRDRMDSKSALLLTLPAESSCRGVKRGRLGLPQSASRLESASGVPPMPERRQMDTGIPHPVLARYFSLPPQCRWPQLRVRPANSARILFVTVRSLLRMRVSFPGKADIVLSDARQESEFDTSLVKL